ncbi:MAG: hypothetical protein H3C63_01005, partial [Candidatus Omnitrophica bacterium]|nr:hypothetical protein [Candidatus Omnitrophota bacterium]
MDRPAAPRGLTAMKLMDYLSDEQIVMDLKATTKIEVLKEVADFAYGKGLI